MDTVPASPLAVPIQSQNAVVNNSLATSAEKYSNPAREGNVGFIEGIIEEVIALEAITIAIGFERPPELLSGPSS